MFQNRQTDLLYDFSGKPAEIESQASCEIIDSSLRDFFLNTNIRNCSDRMNTIIAVGYICISVMALFGNTLTIMMLALEKQLLKKSYNMLILVLAITDVLITVNVTLNPSYGFVLDATTYPKSPILQDVFCRFIYSRVIVFHLVFFSIYITLVLTAERWWAVVRPHTYKSIFSCKRVLAYIVLSWIWVLLLMVKSIIDNSRDPSANKVCQVKTSLRAEVNFAVYVLHSSFKVSIPCITMICMYAHMTLKTMKSPAATAESKAKLKGKMTRMVATTTIILIVLFFPNQIVFTAIKLGKGRFNSLLHQFTNFLTYVTTCINPLIYGLSNETYRRRYRNLLTFICSKTRIKLRKDRRVTGSNGRDTNPIGLQGSNSVSLETSQSNM